MNHSRISPRRDLPTSIATALGALVLVASSASAAVLESDLVTGSVPGGAFVAGDLRTDESVIIWRTQAPWALLDVRIMDTAADGQNAVVNCYGRVAGGSWVLLASATARGRNNFGHIYGNFYTVQSRVPRDIQCTLTVGSRSVTDTNTRGGA